MSATQLEYPATVSIHTRIDAEPSGRIEVAPIALEAVESGLLSRFGRKPRLVFDVEMPTQATDMKTVSYAEWLAPMRARCKMGPITGNPDDLGRVAADLASCGTNILVTSRERGRSLSDCFCAAASRGHGQYGLAQLPDMKVQREIDLRSHLAMFRSGTGSVIRFAATGEMHFDMNFDYWLEV